MEIAKQQPSHIWSFNKEFTYNKALKTKPLKIPKVPSGHVSHPPQKHIAPLNHTPNKKLSQQDMPEQ